MDKKLTGIVAYIGILCGVLGFVGKLGMLLPLVVWLVAYFAGDRNGAKVHLNQSLVLIIIGLVAAIIDFIPLIGFVVGIVVYVLTAVLGILGLIAAVKEDNKKLPIIGNIQILK